MPSRTEGTLPILPADMSRAMGSLHALAQLLHCVDEARWDSMARPAANDLAALLFSAHGELQSGLADYFETPDALAP